MEETMSSLSSVLAERAEILRLTAPSNTILVVSRHTLPSEINRIKPTIFQCSRYVVVIILYNQCFVRGTNRFTRVKTDTILGFRILNWYTLIHYKSG